MTDTSSYTPPTPIEASAPPVQQTIPTQQSNAPGGMTFDQVENAWIQAGGSPQVAAMAAAVADAESGLNPSATRTNPDGTIGVGLWLLPANGSPPGSTDPIANARAAIQLSQGGTDWTQWCSAWSDNNCGENGGTYLGSGANALMSLGTQGTSQTPSFSAFGTTPAGNGVGASSATAGSSGGTTTSSSSKKKILVIGIIIAVIVAIVYSTKKLKTQQPPEEGTEET